MAYKTFQNGLPLYASEINENLMNQSVIVFDNATVRDATLTEPIEGMTTYLKDTNLVEVYTGSSWESLTVNGISANTVTTAGDLIVADGAGSVIRLAAGTNGQVLAISGGVPSYQTFAPGFGGWTQLATGSLPTGAGLSEITGFASYKNYAFQVSNVTMSGTLELWWTINGTFYSIPTLNTTNSVGTSSPALANMGSTAVNASGSMTIYSVGGTAATSQIDRIGFVSATTSSSAGRIGKGALFFGSSVTSIGVQAQSGNITAGTYTLWGA